MTIKNVKKCNFACGYTQKNDGKISMFEVYEC